MENRGIWIPVTLAILILGAAAAVLSDTVIRGPRSSDRAWAFQEAAGGLGMGAIATPMWQFMNYDPRILSVDDSMVWPVPGGYSYGPDRTATVAYFEEKPVK